MRFSANSEKKWNGNYFIRRSEETDKVAWWSYTVRILSSEHRHLSASESAPQLRSKAYTEMCATLTFNMILNLRTESSKYLQESEIRPAKVYGLINWWKIIKKIESWWTNQRLYPCSQMWLRDFETVSRLLIFTCNKQAINSIATKVPKLFEVHEICWQK